MRSRKDSFLQDEMRHPYVRETPDQMKAIEAVKADMESPSRDGSSGCGDVGFGKRKSLFSCSIKAVADSKQVAVLVPTTVLSHQHYNTQETSGGCLPIEYISRMKKSADIGRILKIWKGKVDIIIRDASFDK